VEKRREKNNPSQQCDLSLAGGNGIADSTTMYASTWGMAERICRDDKEPVASFGEFVYDYGDLGIYNTVFCGGFSKHWMAQITRVDGNPAGLI
jgi:hypothetical protein